MTRMSTRKEMTRMTMTQQSRNLQKCECGRKQDQDEWGLGTFIAIEVISYVVINGQYAEERHTPIDVWMCEACMAKANVLLTRKLTTQEKAKRLVGIVNKKTCVQAHRLWKEWNDSNTVVGAVWKWMREYEKAREWRKVQKRQKGRK